MATPRKKPEDKLPVGRRSDYNPAYHPKKAYELAFMNMRNYKIANFFDISEQCLYEWIKKYPEFSEALENAREVANSKVTKSLFKRAVGYNYNEVVFEKTGNMMMEAQADGEMLMVPEYRKKITKKHVPGDVSAQMRILTNKMPDEWKDKQTVETESNIVTMNVEVSAEEAVAIAKKLKENL